MKLFLLSILFTACTAAKLDSTYLPPSNARTSGGDSNILSIPRQDASNSAYGLVPQSTRINSYSQIPILRYSNDNNGEGAYNYEYETGNGIRAQEAAQLKNAGTDQESIVVQGSYSYTGDDGVLYTVTYIADENGFQAQGVHLPTPPPIPDAILKSLQYNAVNADRNQQDGAYRTSDATNRQYLAPPKTNFNSKSGYNYKK